MMNVTFSRIESERKCNPNACELCGQLPKNAWHKVPRQNIIAEHTSNRSRIGADIARVLPQYEGMLVCRACYLRICEEYQSAVMRGAGHRSWRS